MTKIFVLIASIVLVSAAQADINGKPIVTTTPCDGIFATFDFICSVAGIKCSPAPGGNFCASGSQELFAGATLELAKPGDTRLWTGYGGMGEVYQTAATCLLRDLKDGALTSSAKAPTPFGAATIEQDVNFLSFDKNTRQFKGYHHAKACLPVVGCFDAFTQKFTLTPVSSNLKGSGTKIGGFDAYGSHGWLLETEGINQGIFAEIPALSVDTPYGTLSAQPRFGFKRTSGFVLAPYQSGNNKSSVSLPFGAAKTEEIYGRNPGLAASQIFPSRIYGAGGVIDERLRIGWQSQVGLGSRDAGPKNKSWQPPAGVEFPVRGDTTIGTARSDLEKTANVAMGADVRIEYNPMGLLPEWITSNGLISTTFKVWVDPNVEAAFTSQFNFVSGEYAKWDGKTNPTNAAPFYLVQDMDQAKNLSMFAGTSAATRAALDAGVDLNLHFHLDLWVGAIDKDLIDIHPHTTLVESAPPPGVSSASKKVAVFSQASEIMKSGKYFQAYNTFNGPKDGVAHIKECLAKPTANGPEPEAPKFQQGDPSAMTDNILYPCDICVGMDTFNYKDKYGNPGTVKGFLEFLKPADINTKSPTVRWTCKSVFQSGCYDMCSWDKATGKLTVVKTAIEMIASGEMKNVPGRCR